MSVELNTISSEVIIEAFKEEFAAKTSETRYGFEVAARSRVGALLQTVRKNLGWAEQITRRGSQEIAGIQELQQTIVSISTRVERIEKDNREKLGEKEEQKAWSTIRKIGAGYVRTKATTAAILLKTVSWIPFANLSLPQLHLPSLPRPSLPSWMKIPSPFSKNSIPSSRIPDISPPDLPEFLAIPSKFPSIAISLPDHLQKQMAEIAVEQAVDTGINALQQIADRSLEENLRDIERRIAKRGGEEGRQCWRATRTILHHRTASCIQRTKSCWQSMLRSCLRFCSGIGSNGNG